jgi:hypothetical protein
MVEDFPGSVVLEQNARGHYALGNVIPSVCTLNYLRDYLRDGSLPQPGTVCGEDCNVFDESCFEEGESSKAIIFGYRICRMRYVIMKYEMLEENGKVKGRRRWGYRKRF